jgi:hypothetical protein
MFTPIVDKTQVWYKSHCKCCADLQCDDLLFQRPLELRIDNRQQYNGNQFSFWKNILQEQMRLTSMLTDDLTMLSGCYSVCVTFLWAKA